MWAHPGVPQRIVCGEGAVGTVGEEVRGLGLRRVLLVTTAGRMAAAGQGLTRSLGGALASTFEGVEPHVPATSLQQAVMQARRDGVDGVVSLGGGSAIDTAKAICFFAEQQAGTPGVSFADRPALPHVAVPTTCVASCCTPTFGMTDSRTRNKTGTSSPTIAPRVVVADPSLVADLEPQALLSSALVALGHAIEAMWSPGRTPEAQVLAQAAAGRLAKIVGGGTADVPVGELTDASLLAARASAAAGSGIHQAVCDLLGGRTGIAHGLLNAILLPVTTRFSAEGTPDQAEVLGSVLGGDTGEALEGLVRASGLARSSLADAGVTDDDVEAVARLSGGHPAVQRNVRPAGESDVRALLEEAL